MSGGEEEDHPPSSPPPSLSPRSPPSSPLGRGVSPASSPLGPISPSRQARVPASIISRPPARPTGRAPGMAAWAPPQWPSTEPPQWPAGWPGAGSPWPVSPQEAALRMGVIPGSLGLPPSSWPPASLPSDPSAAFAHLSRAGIAHPREHLLQRAVQPGYPGARDPGYPGPSYQPTRPDPVPRPDLVDEEVKTELGVSTSSSPATSAHSSASVSPRGSTLITRQTPDPGEVTIEKEEQSWAGATPGYGGATPRYGGATSPRGTPASAPSAGWAPPRQAVEQQRPPARRSRMRDLISNAVRSALTNHSLEDEAERFNNQMGSTFASTIGPPVKKEK